MAKSVKNRDRKYIIYCCCLLPIVLAAAVFAIMHPRPNHILAVVVLLITLLVTFVFSDRAKYNDPYPYEKAKKAWEKQAARSKKQKLPIPDRPLRPAGRTAAKLEDITMTLLLILFVGVFWFGMFFNLFLPYHPAYEYRGEIAALKARNPHNYDFFPDRIPAGTRDVIWYVQPSFLQGSGFEILSMVASPDFIREYTDTYGEEALKGGSEMDFPQQNWLNDTQMAEVVVYQLYDNNNWNHPHRHGFYVIPSENIITFYCE